MPHCTESSCRCAVRCSAACIKNINGLRVYAQSAHCATGRADCVVVTADTVYIFEFKLDSNGSAEDALAQIKESGYTAPYMASDKKIVLIGAGFDEQARILKDWTTAVPNKA